MQLLLDIIYHYLTSNVVLNNNRNITNKTKYRCEFKTKKQNSLNYDLHNNRYIYIYFITYRKKIDTNIYY